MAEAKLDRAVSRNHARDLELNGLREAMRAMEQTSDAKAALGKLHEEVRGPGTVPTRFCDCDCTDTVL